MDIYRIKIFFYFILLTRAFPIDCSCCLTEQYFNENILSYPFSFFDAGSSTIQPVLYQYEINTDCGSSSNLSITVEYKIFSPNIGISSQHLLQQHASCCLVLHSLWYIDLLSQIQIFLPQIA